MFQFATGLAISKLNNTELKLDISSFENYTLHNGFELDEVFLGNFAIASLSDVSSVLRAKRSPLIRKVYRRLFTGNVVSNYIIEPDFNYWSEFKRISNNTYIEGYWQSERYFKDISQHIQTQFKFKQPLTNLNMELAQSIQLQNSVSIHIRRGDYISNKKNLQIYNTCDINYYKNAINHILQRVSNPTFYVFSDDISWAKSFLAAYPCVFIDHNKSKNSYIDMQLMSMCKHNIIANSSFSWWGAWLNSYNRKIVIAPKKWFYKEISTEDLIPKSWLKL
jgi:hypothetical protein